MQVPRDWDDSGTVDSDEFPTDQDDGACFTFALKQRIILGFMLHILIKTQDSDVTFTQCLYWSELNSDIDDVWSEMQVIDEASDIPEFSSL